MTDSWVREDLQRLNEELKIHETTASTTNNTSSSSRSSKTTSSGNNNSTTTSSSSSSDMGEIMEASGACPSTPVEIMIPDDEYDNIMANLDLDAFIRQYGQLC